MKKNIVILFFAGFGFSNIFAVTFVKPSIQLADGKKLVVEPYQAIRIKRYTANGLVDTSFGVNGVLETNEKYDDNKKYTAQELQAVIAKNTK